MTLVEGFGDEVLVAFAIITVLITLAVGWISTHVQDVHFFSETFFNNLHQGNGQQPQQHPQQQQQQTHSSSSVSQPSPSSEAPTTENNREIESDTSQENTAVSPSPESGEQSPTLSAHNEPSSGANIQSGIDTDTAINSDINQRTDHRQNSNHIDSVVPSTISEDVDSTGSNSSSERPVDSNASSIEPLITTVSTEPSNNVNSLEPSNLATDPVETNVSTDSQTSHLPTDELRKRRINFLSGHLTGSTPLNTEVNINQPAQVLEEQGAIPTNNSNTPSTEQSPELLEGHIRLRLKDLSEMERVVQVRPEDTIGQLKRTHFAAELADDKVVRLICNGRELKREELTIQAYNLTDNCILHCLIRQVQQPSVPGVHLEVEEDLELGMYMFPLFGIILALVWYCRIVYREFFDPMATFSLIGMTLVFTVVMLASFLQRDHEPLPIPAHLHVE